MFCRNFTCLIPFALEIMDVTRNVSVMTCDISSHKSSVTAFEFSLAFAMALVDVISLAMAIVLAVPSHFFWAPVSNNSCFYVKNISSCVPQELTCVEKIVYR